MRVTFKTDNIDLSPYAFSCWIAVGAGDKGAIWAFVVPMLLVVLVRSLACNAIWTSVLSNNSSSF